MDATPMPPERTKGRMRPYIHVLTPEQEAEAWTWHKAREALGSIKTKAAHMKLSPDTLRTFIHCATKRERLAKKRQNAKRPSTP